MKKVVIAWVLTLALLLSVVGVASAVTDGELDNGRHPYVGLMAVFNADGEYEWRCSGTLIAPRVFLTAGHCTEAPADHVRVWFDDDVESFSCPYVDGVGYTDCGKKYFPWGGGESYTGKHIYTHPDYYNYAWFTHDLGVVILDKNVKMDEYGALPKENKLDELAAQYNSKDITFTSVGYGLQKSFPDAASWKEVAEKVRMVSYPHLLQINTPGFTGDFSILLSNNAATGGTCYGDSGGPNFLGESNVVAGVTSYGLNWACGGTGGVYRIDKADDLDWLATFGVYPPTE